MLRGAESCSKKATDLKTVYENCDYISLHIPLTNETRGIINEASLAQMKKGIRIVNLSCGELVNDNDIKAALESGQAGCYVTDFP